MLELNKIYNMDCIDGLKSLDDNTVDLIVTSPPYNVGIEYDSWDDNMQWNDYLNWCRKWLTECYRVLKDDGRICINHYFCNAPRKNGDSCSRFPLFDFKNIMDDIGYTTHKIAIWDDLTMKKQTAWGSWMSASAPFIQTPYEGILIAYKKQWNKINNGESTISRGDFMELASGVWHIGTTISYTMACFPERLPQLCIDGFSYKGDVVLDPFSGSGTTCYVAKSLDRKFIGFEISENYWRESISRLNGNPYKVEPNNNPYNKKEEDKTKEELW
jgi:site-specific DNA-methyltransferase (adenine-specific)